MARSEIGLASLLHKSSLKQLNNVVTLRQDLIDQIHTLRKFREQGVVAHFAEHDFDADVMQFVKIGHGSMGGKALGLAFMASQLKKNGWLQEKYPQLAIAIPPTLLIPTEGFHALCSRIISPLILLGKAMLKLPLFFLRQPCRHGLKYSLVPSCNRYVNL